LWLLACLLPVLARIRNDDNPTGRDIHIINRSDVKVDIFWVNPTNGELVKSVEVGILKGTDTQIQSYIGHEFEIQELPKKTTGKCTGENDECMKGRFVVTSNEDQKFLIENDLSVSYEDARSRAMEKAKQVSQECPMPEATDSGMPDLEKWSQCLQQKINATLDISREEIEFQAGIRKGLGNKLLNYACGDEEFPASISTYNQTLNLGLGPQRNPKMKYLFQSDNTKIVLIEDFVARSQCKWLKETAARSGGNKISWKETSDVAIRTVAERVYKTLDQVLEYKKDANFLNEMKEKSPHPLFEVHASSSSATPKRFLAEEDERQPLMGSFMLFCDVPEKGGYIHFPKSGVHVKPEAGQALLVSYMNPKTGEKDKDTTFTTEHVECPVVEGTSTTLAYHIPFV